MTHEPGQAGTSTTTTQDRAERRPRAEITFASGSVIASRYRVRSQIGQGGMATVLHVERMTDERPFALKYCNNIGLRRKRLFREARILGRLSHPHVIEMVDSDTLHEPPFFVMPLALSSLESQIGRFAGDLDGTLTMFRQVCLGVQAIHDVGVIHRDLKPANILEVRKGHYVVADLGVAKSEPRNSIVLTRTRAVLGTLGYLAPEQLNPGGSRGADVRTDIYQLGKILYRVVSGRSPAVVDPSRVPAGLAHIIQRASSPLPEDRYADIHELLIAIETYRMDSLMRPRHPLRVVAALVHRMGSRPDDLDQSGESLAELLLNIAILEERGPARLMEGFDRLPVPLLEKLARQQPQLLLRPLSAYVRALRTQSARRHYSFADLVASRMGAVVRASTSSSLTARALQAILVTSVSLNRYSAMNELKSHMYKITETGDALAVAEMLREDRDYLHEIAAKLDPRRLHSAIRDVLDERDWIETVSF